MGNLVYKEIDKKDEKQLRELINNALQDLENSEFFIPFKDDDIENMFNKNKAITYGAYDNQKLVATGQLYLEEEYVKEIKGKLCIANKKVSEFGGYLVLPNYRNQGIMRQIQERLTLEARKMNFEYAIITAHPDNKPSNNVIKHSGAELVKTAHLEGYLRNIYLLKL